MKVLVLGSGAREHAVAWKLAASKDVEQTFVGPGNAGTADIAQNLPTVDPLNVASVLQACRSHAISCVFVGPEAPLAAGVVDLLSARRIPAVGPRASAARLESSKAFSKAFLVRNGIPTARAAEFDDREPFEQHVHRHAGERLVVKKSGLAAGKGVLESSDPDALLDFGRGVLGADHLLVEEFLEGWEVSIFGVSDGKTYAVLPPCTDFKKAGDGDNGPNTGGMGAVCPVPWVDGRLLKTIRGQIVEPTYAAMDREGLSYAGILYFGLMVTRDGPKVLEFNVRLGDPETQVLLPSLDLDFGKLVEAMATGTLANLRLGDAAARASGAALGVVVAGAGYPESTPRGQAVEPILGLVEKHALAFHASTQRDANGVLRTGGGRCFTVVGRGRDLKAAFQQAYAHVDAVRFQGSWYRKDIGRKFLDTRHPPRLAPISSNGRRTGGLA